MADRPLSGTRPIRIEVAYARPERQWVIALEVVPGSNVRQAIESSGLLAKCPDIDLTRNAVGIFGRKVPLTQVLKDGDRVEIYRPLINDPKQLRRERAQRGQG